MTPSSSSNAACPAAVPPPWLPIAATTNGSNPSARTVAAAAAATIRPICGDAAAAGGDRHPAARSQTRRPGGYCGWRASVAAATSATAGCWYRRRTRAIEGRLIGCGSSDVSDQLCVLRHTRGAACETPSYPKPIARKRQSPSRPSERWRGAIDPI